MSRSYRTTLQMLLPTLVLALTGMGCANFGHRMKGFLGGAPPADGTRTLPQKYSEQNNAGFEVKRQYKRMTRGRFEEESQLGGEVGSLWNMEGQGSYLASENLVRVVGDIVNVKVDGAPKRQLETKTAVITKLLRKLNVRSAVVRAPAASPEKDGKGKTPAKKAAGNTAPENTEVADAKAVEEEDDLGDSSFQVDIVPTRIVERLADGNYRVKGTQAFMIGKREYRVIVTGIAKSQDLNDTGIEASKLLDPQFDIISKKGM
jgi:flagellar L-ring protein precursor FlgH